MKIVLGSLHVILFLCLHILFSEEVCKFAYKGQPEDFHDSTMVVPDDMVAMSEYQYVGIPLDTTLDTINSPAIMFVIDQSGSMCGTVPGLGVDVEGNRFSVTRDVIDTLSKIAPGAEVGIAIFNEYLYFDPKDDPIFKQCPQEPVGAYIPLLMLSREYNGQTGDAVLKKWLECDTVLSPPFPPTINLKYKPPLTYNAGNTHINAGFYAVKDAMSATSKAKENQFVIFISDGIANIPEDNSVNDYVQGTGVPTTFTIFFVANGTNPPQELTTMTTNIKNNGYSTSNPQSNIWGFKNTGYDTLMTFIMENIIDLIIHQIKYVPVTISINGGQVINNWDSTGFIFPKLFPLLGVTTDFTFDITYSIINDTFSLARIIPPNRLDTTITTEYKVEIDPNQDPLPDSLYDVRCWDRALGFYYNGAQVTTVDETMTPLELRFIYTPGDAQYNYSKASIEITNTSATGRDIETVTLTKNNNTFSGTFPLAVIDDAVTPAQNDGTLQHYAEDNLTAVFRNDEDPKLPLDTLKVQIPFDFGGTINISKAYYFDNDAEGYVDSIFVEATTDITGGLTNTHVSEIIDKALKLPTFRGFAVNSAGVALGGFYIRVTEDDGHDPVTVVTNDDIIEVASVILSAGGQVQAATIDIIDKIAPIIHWETRAAVLSDYQVAGRTDTLSVRFSEPVRNTSSNEPFYFLDMSSGSNYTVTLRAAGMPSSDRMTFEVVSVSGAMEDGDSLWIHETDRVCDTVGNYQNNTKNIKRRLYVDKVYGSVAFDCAWYFDNTGDGFVDSISVKSTTDIQGGYTEAMVDEIVDKALALPAFRNFTVTNSGLTSGGFFITVTESNTNPTTHVTSNDKLETKQTTLSNGGNVPPQSITVYDKVAPLILWEARSALAIVHQDQSVTDTLFVTFSEPVRYIDHEIPFRFLTVDKATNNIFAYTAILNTLDQPLDDKMVFAIQSLSGAEKLRDGDSIWIYEGDRVGDVCKDESGNTVMNYQNNTRNTKRRLYVERRLLPFSLVPVAVSPLRVSSIEKSDKYIIPDKYIRLFEEQGVFNELKLRKNGDGNYVGMIVNVVPDDLENVFAEFKLKGEITILDPVGNIITKKQKMGWDDEKKRLIFAWNVKNTNGRYVGPGMYLSLIEIEETTEGTENSGLKEMKKLMIGVK